MKDPKDRENGPDEDFDVEELPTEEAEDVAGGNCNAYTPCLATNCKES